MSLNHIVESLIKDTESTSRFHRAIRLFEFQVSLFYQSAFKRLVANETDLNSKLKIARMFAAIKILEKIEADVKQQKNSSVISIQELAANENYRSIFDGEFAANGGWSRIRRSAKRFDKEIAERRREARFAVNIVDFSYRFSRHPVSIGHSRRRTPGGVDSARYVVQRAYKPAGGESTIKSRWRRYGSSAIFLYLISSQNFDVRPPRVSSRKFVERLLQQAVNIEGLRRYFCAYQVVRAALLHKNYKKFPALDLDLQCSPLELNAAELTSDIKAAFTAWVTA